MPCTVTMRPTKGAVGGSSLLPLSRPRSSDAVAAGWDRRPRRPEAVWVSTAVSLPEAPTFLELLPAASSCSKLLLGFWPVLRGAMLVSLFALPLRLLVGTASRGDLDRLRSRSAVASPQSMALGVAGRKEDFPSSSPS